MKFSLTLFISLLSTVSMAQEAAIKDFGFKAHVYTGNFTPVPDFREVYEKGRKLYGFDGLVGYKDIYLVGKHRIFETANASKTQLLPDGGQANWAQDFTFLGFRAYDNNKKNLNGYFEIGYVRTHVKETIRANNPLYSSLDGEFKRKFDGLEAGMGLELKVWVISLESGLVYAYIPESFGQESRNENVAGGLLFTIGMGLAR